MLHQAPSTLPDLPGEAGDSPPTPRYLKNYQGIDARGTDSSMRACLEANVSQADTADQSSGPQYLKDCVGVHPGSRQASAQLGPQATDSALEMRSASTPKVAYGETVRPPMLHQAPSTLPDLPGRAGDSPPTPRYLKNYQGIDARGTDSSMRACLEANVSQADTADQSPVSQYLKDSVVVYPGSRQASAQLG